MYMNLNKVYEFDLGDMSHCETSHEEMIRHYSGNSSPLSFYIEQWKLPVWFSNLVYDPTSFTIDHKGHPIKIKPDLRDKETRTILYDQKAFNGKGGSFKRSSAKGIGRVYIKELNDAWAKAQVFIWTDFTNLPIVRTIALTGEECLERWPSGTISKNDREELFSG